MRRLLRGWWRRLFLPRPSAPARPTRVMRDGYARVTAWTRELTADELRDWPRPALARDVPWLRRRRP
jgi:hypothetical protein